MKSRGMAKKRLMGRSPRSFEVMVFFINITQYHWLQICIFPKLMLIISLDSMRGGSGKVQAHILFRWLYNDITTGRQKQMGCLIPLNQTWDGLSIAIRSNRSNWMGIIVVFGCWLSQLASFSACILT
jgi:hypothetical protein